MPLLLTQPARPSSLTRSSVETIMHSYIMYGRPLGALAGFIAFAAFTPFAQLQQERWLLVTLLAAVLVAVGYLFVARAAGSTFAFKVSVYGDLFLVAATALALDRPELLAIGYVTPIGLAAYFLSTKDTVVVTVVAIVLTAWTSDFMPGEIPPLVMAVDLIALALVGALLSLMTAQSRSADQEMELERSLDLAALRMTEAIRQTLDVEAVLSRITHDVGAESGADICLIYTDADVGGAPQLYIWERSPSTPGSSDGVATIAAADAPLPVAHVMSTMTPLVVSSLDDLPDPALRESVAAAKMAAVAFYPLVWNGNVVGVLGLAHRAPVRWSDLPAERLLIRLMPQITAALAQSMVFHQQAEALARLAELSDLREQLIANISHELRTPLTSILGFLQTMNRTDLQLTAGEREQFLNLVESGALRLKTLVDDLLDVNRMQRGSLPLALQPVSLGGIVDRVVSEVVVPPERAVEVRVGDVCLVEADPDRMFQVIANLVVNAVRHGRGRVTIEVDRDGPLGVVRVSDEGDGVPREWQDEIFEPFVHWGGRTDSSGLGLAIARGIVEAHGGSLDYLPSSDDSAHAFVIRMQLYARSEPVAS